MQAARHEAADLPFHVELTERQGAGMSTSRRRQMLSASWDQSQGLQGTMSQAVAFRLSLQVGRGTEERDSHRQAKQVDRNSAFTAFGGARHKLRHAATLLCRRETSCGNLTHCVNAACPMQWMHGLFLGCVHFQTSFAGTVQQQLQSSHEAFGAA